MKFADKMAKRLSIGLLLASVSWALGVGGAVQAAPPYGAPGNLDSWFKYDEGNPLRLRNCSELTDYQLRQSVGRLGYVHIFIGGDIGPTGNVEVKGALDGKVYLLEVDKCSGKIEAAKLLRG